MMIWGDVGGASRCKLEWGGDGSAVRLLFDPAMCVDGIDHHELAEHQNLVNPMAGSPCGDMMERKVSAVEREGGWWVLE